jgi:hypothetical protein
MFITFEKIEKMKEMVSELEVLLGNSAPAIYTKLIAKIIKI